MKAVQNLIRQKDKPFNFNTKFEDIALFVEENRYSHFPVVDDGVYMGSIVAIDIIPSKTKTVGDYRYALLPYFVRQDASWFEVMEKFAQFDCTVLTVLNQKNKYIGYYFYDDIIPYLYHTPFLKDAGLAIVVTKHYMDYSISEIAQIVETNNSKLLGIFVSNSEDQMVEITVKASSGNINEIIQTFRRFGYEIISEHNQDSYLNELKDRSAYLDKYLNI
ncbi:MULTISPECIES: CBS domain-containing protein [unclassified Flavobacterium]|uniref:CBS domain-containing protein n=1 Tax=unclassified Flavobacterium TaxID=196869 RepID=UPI0013D84485|nr:MULTISPECIES: CBS domain-containing protein [unclassified Flavobacterium]MBA5792365.1 acetoin utilization protein acuB [Flavobacterium sp. xlx-221]